MTTTTTTDKTRMTPARFLRELGQGRYFFRDLIIDGPVTIRNFTDRAIGLEDVDLMGDLTLEGVGLGDLRLRRVQGKGVHVNSSTFENVQLENCTVDWLTLLHSTLRGELVVLDTAVTGTLCIDATAVKGDLLIGSSLLTRTKVVSNLVLVKATVEGDIRVADPVLALTCSLYFGKRVSLPAAEIRALLRSLVRC
ncbi:MAG: hypothetical protein HY369_01290 [Candidatus Aenigmarchaeota archaeon]|nr:hypothetical protein [Candidatus Aenigmarchaeota archaeon]